MEESRRRRYLDAMGIRVWRLREKAAVQIGESALRSELGQEVHQPRGESQTHLPDDMQDASALSQDVPVIGIEHASMNQGLVSASDPKNTDATEIAAGNAEKANARDAVATMDWNALCESVAGCRACTLCETRTQTVFGVGATDADLMIIGEAPGADEDRQGEPFVGRAGQLLNLMLASIGLARDKVYIANILKCRPPGNRNPHSEEAAACRAFLMRQIALVQPRLILSAGGISAHNLLDTDEAVGRLRGRWFEFSDASVPLIVTYHPSYLLRSPEQKAKAWEDLQRVARKLRGD